LLAPTASDLVKYGKKDTILAGFHSDLNFLTIHGRSRYPGLHVWARNTGKRIPVKIPPGNNLLVQAGKQLEHITGGLIKAGFHEVVVNDQTLAVGLLTSSFAIYLNPSFRSLKRGKRNSLSDLSFVSPRRFSGTCPLTMILFQSLS
jgi:isopenicillin N synthase-like dioxygenase